MSRPIALALAFGLALAACARKDAPPTPKGEGAPPDSVPMPAGEVLATVAFRAIGNEPFWGLMIDGAGLRFITPDDTAGIRFPPIPSMVMGDTLHWVGETERASIDARIWPSECSDGMSEKIWTHAAHVQIDGTTYRGCAEVVSDRADPIGEWVVVAHRIPGVSAMGDAEATKWHGRVVRYGAEDADSGSEVCRWPDYRFRMVPVDSLLAEFKITPAALGLQGAAASRLGLTEVFCAGKKWEAMGATLIWIAEDRPYTVWDGVFFELRRVEAGK